MGYGGNDGVSFVLFLSSTIQAIAICLTAILLLSPFWSPTIQNIEFKILQTMDPLKKDTLQLKLL